MKCLLLLFMGCFCYWDAGAQNLVPNGSFEQHYSCPNSSGEVDSCIDWYAVSNTPDYFTSCAPYPICLLGNFAGSQLPFDGNAYMGLITYSWWEPEYREIVGTQLISNLIPGNTYHVSMRVSRGNWTRDNYCTAASNKLGIRFTTRALSSHNNNTSLYDSSYVDNFAQLYTDSVISDTLNWVLLNWNYDADSAYKFIYIGNFFADNLTDTTVINAPLGQFGLAYYFIDSVNLICKDCFTGVTNFNNEDLQILFHTESKTLSFKVPNELGVLNIINVSGKKIMEFKVDEQSVVNISNLQDGFYIAVLSTKNDGIVTKKIVIN